MLETAGALNTPAWKICFYQTTNMIRYEHPCVSTNTCVYSMHNLSVRPPVWVYMYVYLRGYVFWESIFCIKDVTKLYRNTISLVKTNISILYDRVKKHYRSWLYWKAITLTLLEEFESFSILIEPVDDKVTKVKITVSLLFFKQTSPALPSYNNYVTEVNTAIKYENCVKKHSTARSLSLSRKTRLRIHINLKFNVFC